MRLVAILLATLLAPVLPLRQQAVPSQTRATSIPQPDGRPFVVHLPDGVSADTCTIDTYQTGTFGGYSGGPESARVKDRTLTIPTSKAAQTMKAVIWCRGFGVALVDVPALESSSYETKVTPPKLPPLKVNARVHPDDAAMVGGRDMRIAFEAGWVCAYFNIRDCLVPRFPVATTRIGKDGTASFELPDVLADPVLKKYGFFGGFAMDVEEPAPAFNYYRLEPSTGRTLTPAAAYRETVTLTIRK